jgi:hypothetical protein
MIMRTKVLIAVSIVALTLVGYFQFPGHTYLQSDSQIYVPMLERFWDPGVLGRDFMVQRPHMAFTIYDEVAIALRRLTGLGFQEVLTFQQLLFRALGLLGVFLVAASFGLGARLSLLVTAILGLGAAVGGPTVLTIEYEPVPRGFALPLLFLAIGLIAHGRDLAASIVASLAFLYHPTTTLAFWAVYFCLACWPAGSSTMRRRVLGLMPLLAAVLVLLLFSRLQTGVTQSPVFFGRMQPWWEELLRRRATYIWVSMWFSSWHWHYVLLWLLSLAAFWRLRKDAYPDLRFFMAGLPLLGILSIPASFLLLEVWKSALGPQLQPAREVLFVTALAGLLAAIAGVKAAQAGRRVEGFLWFLVAFAIPNGEPVQRFFSETITDPVARRRLLLVSLLSAGAALTVWAQPRLRKWSNPLWAVTVLAPFFLFPGYGKVINYPPADNRDIGELSRWASVSTPVEAVFLFPDAVRWDPYPGVFRARALRAVYVDWKSGGQGNYLPSIGQEWWKRWQAVMEPKFKPGVFARYSAHGIDYLVLQRKNRAPGERPAFENSSFVAYRIK